MGIGPGELLFIFVLALIVFGPRRLPEIGRALGKSIREFREAAEEFNIQLRNELHAMPDELKTPPDDLDKNAVRLSGNGTQGLEG